MTNAQAVSAKLRRLGFNPVAPSSRHREGIKVRNSTGGRVSVIVDVDAAPHRARLLTAVSGALADNGYDVTRNPWARHIIYVTAAQS